MSAPYTNIPLFMQDASGNQLVAHGQAFAITNATSNGVSLQSKLFFRYIQRSGGVAGIGHYAVNAPEIHASMNRTANVPITKITASDIVLCLVGGGSPEFIWGFYEFIGTTSGGLCGVGFKADPSTSTWHTFFRDSAATTAPSTLQHGTNTTLSYNTPRRFTVVLDADTQTILWYVGGTLVDSHTLTQPMDYMGSTLKFGGAVFQPASADGFILMAAGAGPQLMAATKGLHPSADPEPQTVGQLWPRGNMIQGL